MASGRRSPKRAGREYTRYLLAAGQALTVDWFMDGTAFGLINGGGVGLEAERGEEALLQWGYARAAGGGGKLALALAAQADEQCTLCLW